MLRNDSVVTIVLLRVRLIPSEDEAWTPSQPEPRQDVVLKACPHNRSNLRILLEVLSYIACFVYSIQGKKYVHNLQVSFSFDTYFICSCNGFRTFLRVISTKFNAVISTTVVLTGSFLNNSANSFIRIS